MEKLEERKGVLIWGEVNVGEKEIEVKNGKRKGMNGGFREEEGEKFELVLDGGLMDRLG